MGVIDVGRFADGPRVVHRDVAVTALAVHRAEPVVHHRGHHGHETPSTTSTA